MSKRRTAEGREIIADEVAVAAIKANGDGRDPYSIGDRVFTCSEGIVTAVVYQAPPKSGDNIVVRVVKVQPLISAVTDGGVIGDVIELERIAAEAREGVQRLDLGGDE